VQRKSRAIVSRKYGSAHLTNSRRFYRRAMRDAQSLMIIRNIFWILVMSMSRQIMAVTIIMRIRMIILVMFALIGMGLIRILVTARVISLKMTLGTEISRIKMSKLRRMGIMMVLIMIILGIALMTKILMILVVKLVSTRRSTIFKIIILSQK
jgi:hypothetical protein